MAINLGTRNRTNMRYGAGEVYVAEGGTISAPSSYGETITSGSLSSLLSSFEFAGVLEKNPRILTDPVNVPEIDTSDPTISFERQHQSRVSAEIIIAEVDNDILNELITRAEAATKTDFLFLRTQDVGDYISFLRNVPYSVQIVKNHAWDEIEKMIITASVLTTELKKVTGQKKIT